MTKVFRDLVAALPWEDQEEIREKTNSLNEVIKSEKNRESKSNSQTE